MQPAAMYAPRSRTPKRQRIGKSSFKSRAGSKRVTVLLDRNGKIPAYLFPSSLKGEIKRYFNPSFWTAETLDDPVTGISSYNILSNIAQGVLPTQRVGDSIFVKMIKIRGLIKQSGGTQVNNCVIALIEDREPAAGQPAFNDVFQGGGATLTDGLNAIMNDDKRARFKIKRLLRFNLMWQSAVQAVGGGSILATPEQQFFDITLKINKRVKFDNTNARPYAGSEYMLWGWSDLSSNTPQVYASVQAWYTDV